MSEHPDWREFRNEIEQQDYLASLDVEPGVRVIINDFDSYEMPLTEEEWQSILAKYELMEKEGHE